MRLILLVGVPGSGKSTIGAQANLPVVSTDAIRVELGHGDFDARRNEEVFKVAYKRITDTLNEGSDVIFDATNLTESSRRSAIAIAKRLGATPEAWVIETDLAILRARNRSRSRVVPEEVIDRMYQRYTTGCSNTKLRAEGIVIIRRIPNNASIDIDQTQLPI
jgi:predicted kinase